MALVVHQSNTDGIAQCGMSRATPKATGCHHRVTTHSAAARATANKTTTKQMTNFAGHFDGHGNAPVPYHVHHLMEEVQGFGRSHWMPPSDEYCGQ
jgi:hypothetical protein